MINVKIKPGFFLVAALIGFLNTLGDSRLPASVFWGTLAWIGIIFVSVLVHEFGHALTAKLFGQKPRIELVAFGGVTIPEGPKLKHWKEFLVILMGPMFGFFLFIGASVLVAFPITNPFLRWVVEITRIVNLVWTFVNLLPILPLDGGQLLRVILETFLKAKAWKVSLYISVVISSLAAIAFFLIGMFLVGVIFTIFVFQGIESLRRMRDYSEADQQDNNRTLLTTIEGHLQNGEQEQAIPKLEQLIQDTKTGLIHAVASEYLAKLYYDKEKYREVYDLLAPIERQLGSEAKCILYLAAYEMGDYQKVISLSGVCFQDNRTFDIAIRAAASHAMLHNIQKALEWLKTARSFNESELLSAAKDHVFDAIRNDERFQEFLAERK